MRNTTPPANDAGWDVGVRQTIAVPLELTDTIDDPGAQWRLTHPAELF